MNENVRPKMRRSPIGDGWVIEVPQGFEVDCERSQLCLHYILLKLKQTEADV